MASFSLSLAKTLRNEGGYVNDPDDPGGETYRGVARLIFGKWNGWTIVDQLRKQGGFPLSLDKHEELQRKVDAFYRTSFWDRISGDDILNQQVADSIFDFAVNAGVGTSTVLAQHVAEVEADGVMGEETIRSVNEKDPEYFLAAFTVAKIARYLSIVNKRPTSRKYFYGWVLRTINN